MIGVVLAGGISSRMGKDKALLPYKGKKFLDYMLHLLQQLNCEEIYISGDIEGYECISDNQKKLGPLGGISTILSHLPDNVPVLFVPVDMPCLTVDTLQNLQLDIYDAVCFESAPLPCIMRNRPQVAIEIETQIQQHKYAIKNVLQKINTQYLVVGDSDKPFLQNINTPEQFKTVIQEQS